MILVQKAAASSMSSLTVFGAVARRSGRRSLSVGFSSPHVTIIGTKRGDADDAPIPVACRLKGPAFRANTPSRSDCSFLLESRLRMPWRRSYVSRAHPRPVPTFHVNDAVDMVLAAALARVEKRRAKWDRNASKRAAKGEAPPSSSSQDKGGQAGGDFGSEESQAASSGGETPYRNQDETIEMAIRLGIDPRKSSQTLRGSVALPHGAGKPVRVAAFTSDEKARREALEAGASVAGGDDLVEEIRDGTTTVTDFDRAVASAEMIPKLGRIARVLGPRGLMPNPKLGTVAASPDELHRAVRRQMSGLLNYRVDKFGNVHVPIGKVSFGRDKLLDHIRTVMNEIVEKKPEGAKGTYLLQVYLTATQGDSIKLDLKTVDPGSPFYMTESGSSDAVAA